MAIWSTWVVNISALFIFARGNGLILGLTRIRIAYTYHFLDFILYICLKIYLSQQGA